MINRWLVDVNGDLAFPLLFTLLTQNLTGEDYDGGKFFVQPGKKDVGRQHCQELYAQLTDHCTGSAIPVVSGYTYTMIRIYIYIYT